MIGNVTNTTQSAAASATSTQATAPSNKVHCQTPFGDVLVDEISTSNIQALFDRRATGAATDDEAAALKSSLGLAPTQSCTTDPQTATSAQLMAAAAETPATNPATPAAMATPAAQPPAASTVPSAQDAFGSTPWLNNPTGSSSQGYSWQFNPIYFATPQTAQAIADRVGGTVVQKNAMLGDSDGPYRQDEMNNMVQLSNGALINPGLVADFYDHGYSQARIDEMIQQEVQGATAV